MSQPDFKVDTGPLWTCANDFESLANGFKAMEQNYTGQMDVYNGCWGTDTIGQTVASEYLPARQAVPEAIRAISDAIRSYSTSIATAASAYDSVEFGNQGG